MQQVNPPRIAVIILGYNDENNIEETLESTLSQSYKNYQIIYIDNASTDKTLEIVRKKYSTLRIIANPVNLGYAGAYQKALEQFFNENFDAAVLLNSDVKVEHNWLEELVKTAYIKEDIAIAQSKIFLHSAYPKRIINTIGNQAHYLGFGYCEGYKKNDTPAYSKDKNITIASGCSMLIKKNPYQRYGPLDKDFFAYLEDQDLCWRAQMHGFNIKLSANSIVWHKYHFKQNSRNSWKFFMLERNRWFFLIKNFSARTLLLISPALLLMEAGILLDACFKGYLKEKIKSYIALTKLFKQIYKKRKIIQQNRLISDYELFSKLSSSIEFEELKNPALDFANYLFNKYFHLIKKLI